MSDSPDTPPLQPDPLRRRRLRLPVVSGKWTVVLLLCCFLFTGALISLVMRLPKWLDFEIVIAIWWLLWVMILTKLLYKGEQVSDDHVRKGARSWFNTTKDPDLSRYDGCWYGLDFEGWAVIFGLIAAVALVWFLIEIAIPIVFFMLYFLVRGMLARVVNDQWNCRGNVGLSALRGVIWATIYTVPLAFTVWIIHFIHARHA
jgi:hypothetical protein